MTGTDAAQATVRQGDVVRYRSRDWVVERLASERRGRSLALVAELVGPGARTERVPARGDSARFALVRTGEVDPAFFVSDERGGIMADLACARRAVRAVADGHALYNVVTGEVVWPAGGGVAIAHVAPEVALGSWRCVGGLAGVTATPEEVLGPRETGRLASRIASEAGWGPATRLRLRGAPAVYDPPPERPALSPQEQFDRDLRDAAAASGARAGF